MKIVCLVNNRLGMKVLRWLGEGDEVEADEVVGVVVHPKGMGRYRRQILEVAGEIGMRDDEVYEASQLRDAKVLRAIGRLRAEVAVSAGFGYVLRPSFLGLFPGGVLNLHTGFLPFNRGAYPNVWSIVQGTPAGVTLHYMDEGVDTGDVVTQEEVRVEAVDTGESLHRKLEVAALRMFRRVWGSVSSGKMKRVPQDRRAGTSHRVRDVERIDEIDLDASYKAQYLIDVLRARSFPPYTGAYFRVGGRKVYMRLVLEEG